MQDEDLSLMLQTRNLMLPNVGYLNTFMQYWYIVIRNTFFYSLQTTFYCNLLETKPKNFQKLPLNKIFHKAGSSFLRVLSFWEERGQLGLF